jgi:hypothetical protein
MNKIKDAVYLLDTAKEMLLMDSIYGGTLYGLDNYSQPIVIINECLKLLRGDE